jgi:hypothetical protein
MSLRTEWMPSCAAFLLSPMEALSRMKRERQALKSEGKTQHAGIYQKCYRLKVHSRWVHDVFHCRN